MNDVILALLLSFSAPLPLLIIENFLPFPYVIEELLKLVIVLIILRGVQVHQNLKVKSKNTASFYIIVASLLYTLSESVFYLVNFFALQKIIMIPERFFLTGTMHLTTFMLLYFCAKKGKMWTAIGLIGAMILHLSFNLIVVRVIIQSSS